MLVKTIIKSLKGYPWFRRLNAKITYELLAKQIPAAEWQFMNYGYLPSINEGIAPLFTQGVQQKNSIQMYHYLAKKTTIEGKRILEVGSGRGGGAKYIATSFRPASYTGMDIAQSAVKLSTTLHQLPNLRFIQGSAEAIPLADNSMDVVLNVESCHAYGSAAKFLAEVKRVLKPGGYLLLVDFRSENKMHILQREIKDAGMDVLQEEDISDNVIRSIEEEDDFKRIRIRALVPAKWQGLFCEFAGVTGSSFHQTLKDGSRRYYRFVLKKRIG